MFETIRIAEPSALAVVDQIIQVAIIGDRIKLPKSYGDLIEHTEGFAFVGKFSMAEAALPQMMRGFPRLMLWNTEINETNELSGIPQLKRQFPALVVVVISGSNDDAQIFRGLCAGAAGHIPNTDLPTGFRHRLKEALAGGAPITASIAQQIIVRFKEGSVLEPADHDLSPHELVILGSLAAGKVHRTVARELNLSVDSLSFHLKCIYEKLQICSEGISSV